ncbi:hypothetical protein GH714_039668 [Hevea brasiliensis]|uniref:Uncharacterized protein n=1 Tax=Hevea brasiliensis TaxID=3981 RepID=A0A6A6MV25_HEVBR|nr:hypothetical protein GH714_039668 [Hevea brasiliensis]
MTMDRTSPPETPSRDPKPLIVLSIECLKGSSKADEWTGDMLQTGDIVEEIRIGSGSSSGTRSSQSFKAPFKNGKSGIQRFIHSPKPFKNKETSILVRVRRGRDEFAELQACIVPESGSKKQYILRSITDPNYAVGSQIDPKADCFELQDSRSSRIASALSRATLQDGYVSYPWMRRMQEVLPIPNSSCFLSILFLPKVSDRVASRYNDLDDTLARANTWLYASQASGVPTVFMNIQTESLLTKVASLASITLDWFYITVYIWRDSIFYVNTGSLSDLSNIAHVSLYGFEDYHGVDIGVVRAVRLWYAPLCGEFAIEMKIKEGDSKLGFAISRTEEGFIYISSVIDGNENVPSTRSGLNNLYKEAKSASRLLVVSRVSNQKAVLGLGLSPLHHVIAPEIQLARHPSENQILPMPPEVLDEGGVIRDVPEIRLERDTAGEVSFRFHDFSLPNNWV